MQDCLYIQKREGFTLMEVMVVILIAAILSAAAIPLYRTWIMEPAKWTEGKATMGTIASAIRAYSALVGPTGAPPSSLWIGDPCNLGFARGDFIGAFFSADNFSFTVDSMLPLQYTITAMTENLIPRGYTLDQDGKFTKTE